MMLPGLEQMIAQCAPNVAPVTMMAIVKVESAGNPLAINVNGKQRLARQPGSIVEAVAWANWLIDRGYSVDLGLAQVNSRHLRRFGLTAETLLQPCYNIAVGAQILTENYTNASKKFGGGQSALRAAISAYNTGNHTAGFSNGYVRKVSVAAGK
ncbi:MAG: lytic transglycosylase domain-containing protein [Sterolibacterium sp.]|jgi:type IV secretion system protein VirB1|nr:lytic transglycosylase domain-containing protein [Sterolibacterium sp.]